MVDEREWVAPLWLGGYFLPDPEEDGERLQWGPYDAQLVLVNPADRTRTFDLSFTIGTEVAGPFEVTLGAPLNDAFELNKVWDKDDPLDLKRHGTKRAYQIAVPPGRTSIRIRCIPPDYFLPFDKRNLCYFIKDFTLRERR